MRISLLPLIPGLLFIAGAAQAAPKVAVLYSAWSNNSFKNELDGALKSLGWSFEKLENKDVAQWIGRLDEFDLVVATSVANYENPQEMAPYKDAWLRFLERGGGILILDASYGSVLDLWMNRLGPDWALASSGCAPHTKARGGSDAIVCDEKDPLLHVPRDLPPLLRARGGIWAHLRSWGAGWRSLVTCADEKSLFVARDVGKGSVVVTSYFSLRGDASRPLAAGLLENLWTHVCGLRAGVGVTAFDPGKAMPGAQTALLEARNATDQAATYRAVLRVAFGEDAPTPVAEATATAAPGETARFALPYTIARRGPVRLAVGLESAGKTLLALERELAVPPMIAFSARDRHLYPGAKSLSFTTALVPDAGVPLAECAAELLVDGKPVQRLAPPPAAGEVVADVSALPFGMHRAALRLIRAGKTLGEEQIEFFRHRSPRVGSREDGTLLVEGKPFFPFGWYHVSWTFTSEERLAFLRDIAAGGFNTVHAGIKKLEEWDPFLDEAAKLGVRVVTEFGVDARQVIERYREKPAVLAWNPGDEPDGRGVSPREMLDRYDRFKSADPDHPTYMVLCVPSTYRRYAGCAEIIAPDPYPIPRAPIVTVYNSLSSARTEAAKYGRPIWGVLQCFGYEKGPWRVPTFEECRNMTYQALLAGVKGIIYYTYADTGFRMPEHPELWAAMKTLPGEIERIRPYLLDGKPEPLDTGQPDVLAGAWRLEKSTLVCAVNVSQKEPRQVSLSLPAGAALALFAERPSGLAAADGKLSGTLPPLGVAAVEVKAR